VTTEAAARVGDKVYVRNARGAMWATGICMAVSIGILALGAALAF
jgi:hypothetical protein